LEKNVTLSSGYLEELSVRYKKQIEDLQQTARQTVDNLEMTSSLTLENKVEIEKLREEIGSVKEGVEEMMAMMESLGAWVIHRLF
jgi:methyl-accepting chemotaxis protein